MPEKDEKSEKTAHPIQKGQPFARFVCFPGRFFPLYLSGGRSLCEEDIAQRQFRFRFRIPQNGDDSVIEWLGRIKRRHGEFPVTRFLRQSDCAADGRRVGSGEEGSGKMTGEEMGEGEGEEFARLP